MRTMFAVTVSCYAMIASGSAQAQTGAPPSGTASTPLPNEAQPDVRVESASDLPVSTSGTALEEIVVTAQRRSQNLQDVPISVNVATSAELQASGVAEIQDLKVLTPGVEVQNGNGFAIPTIRGVASRTASPGVEAPVAIYVDGVYYTSPAANLLSFNSISQIEVLKGPQGTLFGRNATAGVIQIITRDPSHSPEGNVAVGYGNYDTKKIEGYLTTGLTDDIAVDLAFQGLSQGDGYGTNFYNGRDVYRQDHEVNLRSKWLWQSGPTTARLIFDYSNAKGTLSTSTQPPGVSPPPFLPASNSASPWDANLDVQPLSKTEDGGVSLNVEHDLNFARIASITAYRRTKSRNVFDGDYSPVMGRFITNDREDSQFSQELQLSSLSESPIQWVAGAFYFRSGSGYQPLVVRAAFDSKGASTGSYTTTTTLSRQVTTSYAVYGQATVPLLDELNLTAGLRYTSDRRELSAATLIRTFPDGRTQDLTPAPLDPDTFNALTWRLALDYDLAEDVLVYASYNRGFKSGGFNAGALTLPPFKNETIDAYEVGLKSTLLDRRLRFNAAAFVYDYSDIQVQQVIVGIAGVYNGAQARIYGAEAQLESRLSDALDLTLNYQYLHGRYLDFDNASAAVPNPAGGFISLTQDVTGRNTIFSPKHTLSAVANYEVPLNDGSALNFNATYYYNSGSFQEPDNLLRQPAYSLVNASLRWQSADGNLSIQAWGKNLTNEAVFAFFSINNTGIAVPATSQNPAGRAGNARAIFAAPRTYGVSVGVKF